MPVALQVFEKSVHSLRTKLLEPPRKLADVTNSLWGEIASGRLQWGRKQILADALSRVAATPDRLNAMVRRLLSGPDARHLAVSVYSDTLWKERQGTLVDDRDGAGLDELGLTVTELEAGAAGILTLRASLPTVASNL